MKIIFVILALVVFPLASRAASRDVVINEIAWMGTQASAADEWIELYNNTASPIDFSGWTLSFYKPATTTPSKIIPLSGNIPANGYYLIERTNDSTISDIPADLVSSFGTGLVDSGMIVQLAQNGTVVDRTPELCDNKWCAGSNNPKMTMERVDPSQDGTLFANWATNNGTTINGKDAAGNAIIGTPKSKNSVFVSANAYGGNGSQSASSTTTEVVQLVPAASHGVPLPPQPAFTVEAGENRTVLAGALVEFIARSSVKNDSLATFRYVWNFGDGTMKEGRAVNHIYYFPGSYTANVNMASDELAVMDTARITVLAPLVIISEIKPGENGFVELYHAGKERIDIGGLVLGDKDNKFTLPKNTFLDGGGVLVLANTMTGIVGSGNIVSLYTANGVVVDKAEFSGNLLEKESFARAPAGFVIAKEFSPGVYDVSRAVAASFIPAEQKNNLADTVTIVGRARSVISENTQAAESRNGASNKTADAQTAGVASSFSSSFGFGGYIFFILSAAIGLLAAVGYFFLRKVF